MKKQPKKKFEIPTEANAAGQIGMEPSVNTNRPFDAEDSFSGDSVDELKKMEEFNEDMAKKEIDQIFNNS
ncbi:hypothetical protein [Halobacillus sp. BBL2006]|uniref:hypothetical protein n=1 Tax=Halobacillus sp. BBL2006 TaxID=1543706 RepID=UPI000542A2E7|nr:hypothetical protein [Halobacillus sp. BBL2006]KHE71562.1 hypothetical protein LD39_09140 [Halobacillus sp. BBL2006]